MHQTREGLWVLPSLRYGTPKSALLFKAYPQSNPAGDLLRAEQLRKGSPFGSLIQTCIREGTIVPMDVTIKLLENAMQTAMDERKDSEGWSNGHGRFLIDGFPRKMDQAAKFDETVCLCSLVLFFSTTEEVMKQRLLVRGKTSGREDDNLETIKKRFSA
ncbi:UMP-CMP kinase [Sphagnurus paluster]|uniref:UMP-CMP kinase n=1 Tax=Sphagnurus paluster TaxID=117069 RepID=A0A9P7GII9_9AGAR|nr:UMP-CMP kinase [Sphagnurus paluster]